MNIETQPNSHFDFIEKVVSQWNSVHGPHYQVRASDLIWSFEKQPLLQYETQTLAGTPIVFATATRDGELSGIQAGHLWLSLWGKISDENKFVNELRMLASQKKKKKLILGGEEFHMTPGIPSTEPGLRLQNVVKAGGFEGVESGDYFGDIRSREVDDYIHLGQAEAMKRQLIFKNVTTPTDFSTLEKFLEKEFRGRWAREFQFWKSREDTQRAFWKILKTKEDSVIGFARMAVRGRAMPLEKHWTPGALRMPTQNKDPLLASITDCCLGPIGVAASERGQGTGKILLSLVLESLRQFATERICIDWTNAFKYYEPLNFKIARRYWTAWISEL